MGNTKTFNTFEACMKEAHKDMMKAGAMALNKTAFEAQGYAKDNINRNFTTRNNFTANSVRYTKCPKATKIEDLRSEVGILDRAGYMALQEEGGTKRSKSGANLAIPTTKGARRGNPQNKIPASLFYAKVKEQTIKGVRKASKNEQRLERIQRAEEAYRQKGFIRMKNSLFKVTSFRRTADGKIKYNKKMIYNLKHQSVQIKGKPWLEPAAEKAAQDIQKNFNEAMDNL